MLPELLPYCGKSQERRRKDIMGVIVKDPTPRKEEQLLQVLGRFKNWQKTCARMEEQKQLMEDIRPIIDPVIEDILDKVKKRKLRLPSFYGSCQNFSELKEELTSEITVIFTVLAGAMEYGKEDLVDAVKAYNDFTSQFREAVAKKFSDLYSQARRESVQVVETGTTGSKNESNSTNGKSGGYDGNSGTNGTYKIVSQGKDITEELEKLNPSHRLAKSPELLHLTSDEKTNTSELMNEKMNGAFRAF